MTLTPVSPVVLVILDGWGYREESYGNAIAVANTPNFDSLWAAYPSTLIQTSGKAVGLPKGQMGNSEVGHLNIGAGRTVPQELVRISDAIEDGSIFSNEVLVQICETVAQRQSKLHLVGLCSGGGVHAHLDHLIALLHLGKQHGIADVCVHAILDGRDTPPTSSKSEIETLLTAMDEVGVGRIVTLSGRYFAMDRDRRWDRVEAAYAVMTQDAVAPCRDPLAVIGEAYAQGMTDEFLQPTRVAPDAIAPQDGVIFFNFRPDRARQLTYAFIDPDFKDFERTLIAPLEFATFTQYDASLPAKVAFEPQNLSHILGEVVSEHGLKQLRLAETEKYAHVTYFFNGGMEDPLPGEDRVLIPSPMVPTYDRAPAMSAQEVTDKAVAALSKQVYSLVVINYANTDMVGHTGQMAATIEAVEAVDRCLGQLMQQVTRVGGTCLITADHGNAELMCDEQGNPWTAHTTNPVPFILVEGERRQIPGHGADVKLRENGCLADIAPTILEILQLPQPPEMTGKSLIAPVEVEVRANRSPVRLRI
ncbi:2,3-bisphosphoglycerate-independent phosphoglycerate mutase [Synechococcales cyanobacterium C]|uniref:2,3-bisphosphoglycerate-independent phosphoglycerate mutase n=1 Tax=Petrachloros mirabilis ULC683 TaxID=2781853 RepID=A0A8K1ZXW6_9CYAN|nr:2,3-bisphosphoglycerate-independent phosphoglycerate mutase [Petrachloros mirabilis]NCJ07199.1 2,3-bisphosphoglycerate-independent phosphoglycerate mutase [Petrachloros mirabilis ULC683]